MDLLQGYSSSDSEDSIVEEPDIGIFLLRYATNMRGLHNMYLYIPWQPPSRTLLKLEKAADLVVNKLQLRSRWNKHFGKIGYHVTLMHNAPAEPYKIEQLAGNIRTAIETMSIDRSLIKTYSERNKTNENITKFTGVSITHPSCLRVGFKPKLRVFPSEAEQNIEENSTFVAIELDVRSEDEGFWHQLQDIISTNTDSLGIKIPINVQRYHVSIASAIDVDREEVRNAVENTDVSELLQDMILEFDRIQVLLEKERTEKEAIMLPLTRGR